MIRPGLLTASTSNADHFGMSGFCVCVSDWFCIFFAPSFVLVFLRRCFPLAAKKIETTGRSFASPAGAQRSGALGAKRRVVRMGCREESQRRAGIVERSKLASASPCENRFAEYGENL